MTDNLKNKANATTEAIANTDQADLAHEANNNNKNADQVDNTLSDANKPNEVDISQDVEAFYKRADAIIELANSQLGPQSHSGQVGASLLYAAARYSASVASIGFIKGDDLAHEKNDIVEFYTAQYRKMLSDNLDDYAQNFDKYVKIEAK